MEVDIIYNEDCLEGMERLPDKSIDLAIVDPPYGSGGRDGSVHLNNPDIYGNRMTSDAVACKQLGRHYIGFEINPEYYKIAKRRLSEIQLELV